MCVSDRLSKAYFVGQKKCLDLFLKEIFIERHITKVSMTGEEHRVMMFDDANKRIVSEKPIALLLEYESELQSLFLIYQPENYYRDQIMLDWIEVRLLNLRMPIYQIG